MPIDTVVVVVVVDTDWHLRISEKEHMANKRSLFGICLAMEAFSRCTLTSGLSLLLGRESSIILFLLVRIHRARTDSLPRNTFSHQPPEIFAASLFVHCTSVNLLCVVVLLETASSRVGPLFC
jgi:hypothetical protein